MGHGRGDIAANGDVEGTSYSADGECSAASGPADPEWQPDSEAPGDDASLQNDITNAGWFAMAV